MTIEFNILLK